MSTEQTTADRLTALLDHLGIARAHIAAPMPGDVADFAVRHAERISGLLFCVPSRLDPAPFADLAKRIVTISGARGMSHDVARQAAPRLPGSRLVVLEDYDAPGWADVVRDRTAPIVETLLSLRPWDADPGPRPALGVHAGIAYRIEGTGPALVLLPFFLAPSQWDAALPELTKHFTVIVLGGRHLGGVAALEDRARGPSYIGMIAGLFEVMAPRPGETILDVGCGSGALDRMLAKRYPANPITACDVNPFLLREAAVLAAEDGVAIAFQQGNAERLPFPDASFDLAFSVTVLEECDADQALRELYRVLRPGGRVGVIVRAIDMPQWWHLDLPEPIRRKVTIPPQSNGAKGVADASLYARMADAGFANLTCFPALVTFDQPDGPIWRYREDHVLSQLTEAETAIWHRATADARARNLLFMANPLHRAAGEKPRA